MSGELPRRTPAWRRYLRFWRRDIDADTDDELRLHFERRIEDLVTSGLSPDAARSRTVAEFGDVDRVRDELRDIDRVIERRAAHGEWLASIRDDLRYTVRSLGRSRAFVLTVVATMALGLGLNAAMFTFLDDVFFRPPAGVRDPGQIERVWTIHRNMVDHRPYATPNSNYLAYGQYATALRGVADLAAYQLETKVRIARGVDAPTAVVARVTTNYLGVLGARLARGRWFTSAENRFGAPTSVAVVSEAFARTHGGASILDSTFVIDETPTTVIGIAAPDFTGPDLDAVDVWLPLASDTSHTHSEWPPKLWWQSTNYYELGMVARLAPHANAAALDARLTAVDRATQRTLDHGDSLESVELGPINAARGPGERVAEVDLATRLGLVAAIVLLIACANVINLLLARAVLRRREIGIRVALGGTRARIVRLMTTESVLLAVAAGAAALVAAYWGGTLLRTLLLPTTNWANAVVGWRVVAFTAVASLIAGAFIGLVPALRTSAPSITSFLRSGEAAATRRSRLRSALVGLQAMLATVLLVAALLFVASLRNVEGLDLGYDVSRLLFADVQFEIPPKDLSVVEGEAYRRLATELAGTPGIEDVALSSVRPMTGFSLMSLFVGADSLGAIIHDGQDRPSFSAVTPSYFRTTGLSFVRGGPFTAARSPDDGSVVVNERFASLVWPGANPIGKCLRVEKVTNPCWPVVGVVRDAHRNRVVEARDAAQYYLPLGAAALAGRWEPAAIIVRADPRAMPAIEADLRSRLRRIFPTAGPRITRMADALAPQYRPYRMGAALFTAFGALALIVALVGVYSAVSYAVEQRAREFAIRTALGATARDVVRLVLGQELRAVLVGIAAGTGTVLLGGRVIASMLYGVAPSNARVLALVGLALLVAAGIAAMLPAWRAGGAEPLRMLRAE